MAGLQLAEAEMNSKGSDWQSLLADVLAETDKAKLETKAEELENAIFLRSQELHSNGGTEVERQGMKVAIHKLLKVKVEKLGFPIDAKFLRGPADGAESQE
jgi:hypothetical protein